MEQGTVLKFREILRVFERELDRQNNSGCCCGVTLSQCHVLMELARTDNISLKELAGKLSLDKSAVSRTVESLVSKKMVRRSVPKENRRTTLLSLTGTGTQVCQQINNGNNDYYARALEPVPEDELAVFLNTFENMVSRMSRMNRDQQ